MSQKSRQLFNWQLFDWLAKIFVVLIILGLGLYSIYGVWLTPSRSIDESATGLNPSENDDTPFPTDPQQIFADFTSGAWSFDDSDWDFRVLSSSAASSALALPTSARTSEPGFDDQSIIDQFRELDVQPTPVGDGLEQWESTAQGFTMTLFTRDGVVQLMRTRLPVEQGFTTIEAIPKSHRSEDRKLLLPLIDGATQTAVRVDPAGRVTSAIIEINTEKQIDIRTHWKENGWDVSPMMELVPGFTNESLTNNKFRCVRDGAAIEATFLAGTEEAHAVIVLTLVSSRPGSE